mmetsp:Transcript_22198/g.33821  ORF Transcript_22198/g.33821 Transcript_22198/m.33821 type:complete len:380 (+) Transcript_22198:148-1287(+)
MKVATLAFSSLLATLDIQVSSFSTVVPNGRCSSSTFLSPSNIRYGRKYVFWQSAVASDAVASEPHDSPAPAPLPAKPLSSEELDVISSIAKTDPSSMQSFLMSKLPKIPPNTIRVLRSATEGDFPEAITDEQKSHMELVGNSLVTVMDENLTVSRDLLQSLLRCGEIRKLDAAIAKALKADLLDMAFFTVLSMNLRDATIEERESGKSDEPQEEGTIGSGDNPGRLQILQHIYTRCQEEVEKAVDPGVGLLNKLLRTEQASIRANQLSHYLCPQAPKTIKSPDGKEVQLPGSDALVPPGKLIKAFENAVKQIRTVEQSGAADRTAAVGLVESCRQVAVEARLAIGEGYGIDSEELKEFELGLQPVFRPESADSEYIQGL